MPDRPYADVKRRGRFWWEVELHRGSGHPLDADSFEGTWSCLGERHARSKARRVVRKANRRPNYRAQAYRIDSEE